MKTRDSVEVKEKDGRYWLYMNDLEYLTPFYLELSSKDKGLIEAAARKIHEGKPTLVMKYLSKYSNEELVDLMLDLKQNDICWFRFTFTNKPELCASSFSNLQLRKLIDAYTDCGSMILAFDVVSTSSGWDPCTFARYIENCFADAGCTVDMTDLISDADAEEFLNKYQGLLVPTDFKARCNFFDVLKQFEIEEEEEDCDYEDEYEEEDEPAANEPDAYDLDSEAEADEVASRMEGLDEETLRRFNIVRDFVSKHQDFWADFEDCDAVYRPFFHAGDGEEVMRFWFNPPYGKRGTSYPRESDKLVLTKSGKILVEDHSDGRFYNILDCVGDTLENAVYAIETLGK